MSEDKSTEEFIAENIRLKGELARAALDLEKLRAHYCKLSDQYLSMPPGPSLKEMEGRADPMERFEPPPLREKASSMAPDGWIAYYPDREHEPYLGPFDTRVEALREGASMDWPMIGVAPAESPDPGEVAELCFDMEYLLERMEEHLVDEWDDGEESFHFRGPMEGDEDKKRTYGAAEDEFQALVREWARKHFYCSRVRNGTPSWGIPRELVEDQIREWEGIDGA